MRFCLLARDDSLIEIDLIEKRLDPNTMLLHHFYISLNDSNLAITETIRQIKTMSENSIQISNPTY